MDDCGAKSSVGWHLEAEVGFPFIGSGRARRGGTGERGWPTMVGIQFPTVSRSKRGRGVDGHRASAGE
jgi:hypothetical protein